MVSKEKVPEGKESFEELYTQLETTVAKIEQGGLSLDDSVSLYEEGVNLAQRCQEILRQAEQRIIRLQEKDSADEVESGDVGGEVRPLPLPEDDLLSH